MITLKQKNRREIPMSEIEEEKELQAAITKLQSQIEQQKELVQKMIEFKRRRIQSETTKLEQLKSLVKQQNREEKKLKLTESRVSKPKKGESKMANSKRLVDCQANKIPEIKSVVNFAEIESPAKLIPNKFQKKILANRKNYYYKNRKFFHGYKFVLINNNQRLCIMSAAHEITGEPLKNANILPVFITLNGKNYIKSAKGDYYLENLSKKYIFFHLLLLSFTFLAE